MHFDFAAWGAELTPDRPALWFHGRWLSYRDLELRATGAANLLLEMGVGYGDRVALLSANHPAHLDLFLAAAKIGFIFVPFDPEADAAQLRADVRIVGPRLAISDLRHETLAAQAFSCQRIDLEEYRESLGQIGYRPLVRLELSPESIHSMLFTAAAGDGRHALMIPYRQWLANVRGTAMGWQLGPEDCAIQVLPCWGGGVAPLGPAAAGSGRPRRPAAALRDRGARAAHGALRGQCLVPEP